MIGIYCVIHVSFSDPFLVNFVRLHFFMLHSIHPPTQEQSNTETGLRIAYYVSGHGKHYYCQRDTSNSCFI
jgi:hypothetical protein